MDKSQILNPPSVSAQTLEPAARPPRVFDTCKVGIVLRTVHAEVPPRVDYELTELGHSLQPVLIAMRNWGATYAQHRLHDDAPSASCESEQKVA